MYALERDLDAELVRVYQHIHELSDQLAHNHQIVISLQKDANRLKVRTTDDWDCKN